MVNALLISLGAHVLFVASLMMLFQLEFEMPMIISVMLTVGIVLLEVGLASVGAFVGIAPIGWMSSYTAAGLFVGAAGMLLVSN